jgi:hypothetical protein
LVLAKVEYEFFDHEEPSSDVQELDRQIRLHFADSPTLYVSWTSDRNSGPDSEPYSIAYAYSSYFTHDATRVLDVSDSPRWSRHLGRRMELAYVPSSSHELEYQVLGIRSGSDCTYVYSMGRDVVGLSDTLPSAGPSVAGSQGDFDIMYRGVRLQPDFRESA